MISWGEVSDQLGEVRRTEECQETCQNGQNGQIWVCDKWLIAETAKADQLEAEKAEVDKRAEAQE